jgi:hypothetical protein
LRIPSRSIRDFSTFSALHNFKASSSARCVSAASTVCWNINIFNTDRILLRHISLLLVTFYFCFCFSSYMITITYYFIFIYSRSIS